ncbi:MAG TPA: hypothetical protein G4O08_00220 [Anaerolineae bacterium]|nr:hypothetical protein [Anaerolineae bacterium]
MMKKAWVLLALLALCAIVLPGCTPSTPDCAVADLVQPIPSGPLGGMIVTDLYTELLWSYGAGHECQPDGFKLELATDSSFTTIYSYGGTDAFDTSWGLPTPVPSGSPPPLPPATEFWWRVAGGLDDGAGGLDLGPWSVPSHFFTGPICTDGVGVANLIWPTDGETVTTLLPLLDWEWPRTDCVPEGYRIDLYEDIEPVSDILAGGTGNPSTAWFPGDDLVDCTAYRWFVTPITDITLGTASVEWGFFIDVSGTCSTVGGMVWHDECGLPEHGPFPITPPPGCIDDGVGGYIGNGVIDPGETGIGGVTLNLGAGSCPSTGLATAVTNGSGHYSFGALADGTYCISVDSLADGNDAVIIPGGWSYPAASTSLVSQEIVVSGGTAPDTNFGWDWQFLPVPNTSGIVGTVWHDECAVPYSYTPGDPIPPGCIDLGGGVLAADGIFEATEVGIQGVTVDLGFGPCPSTGAYTALTNLDGTFTIPGLFDGTYCVTVDALAHGNDTVLIPGDWTFPDRGVNPQEVQFDIVVPPEGLGVGLPIQNFGWDYQFLPAYGDEKTGNTRGPANCYLGPSEFFPVMWLIPEYTPFWIEGRDYDGEWLWTIPEGKNNECWLLLEDVHLPFPITEVEVVYEPLLVDGSISGWVKSGGTKPVPGANVTLKSGVCPGTGSGLGALTDGRGSYLFSPVTPGEYCVLAPSSGGYTPQYYNVTVLSSQNVTGIDFTK